MDLVSDEVFGLSYLDSVSSSIQAAIMRLHWSRITAKPLYAPVVIYTVSDWLGFWELGCEHLSVLTALHAVFGSCRIFFAVLRLWMIFSTALRFLIDPLILPHSGVPNGFLLCKLKISLSKITDLPFHSVPCLKLEKASFSYFFWNGMRNSFNFLFLIFLLFFWK